MLWKLILLLTAIPLVELLILVKLTQWWGSFWLTVAVILGTGLVGAVLARREGLRVLNQMHEQMAHGELPGDRILDGLLILLAAALLITPGLLTDAIGFLLLVPLTRAVFRRAVKAWIRRRLSTGAAFLYRRVDFRPVRDEPSPGSGLREDDTEL